MKITPRHSPVVTHTFLATDDETAIVPTGGGAVDIAWEDVFSGEVVHEQLAVDVDQDTGLCSATLPHVQAPPYTLFKATWTYDLNLVDVDYHQIVSHRYFTLAELRNYNDNLSDAATYPNYLLSHVRDQTEDLIEEYTNRPWNLQSHTELVSLGTGGTGWFFPRRSNVVHIDRAKTLTGEDLDVSGWYVDDVDRVWVDGTAATAGFTVEYTHGVNVTPDDLRGAALALSAHIITGYDGATPDRATMQFTEQGTFYLMTAGKDKPTGLPEVDSVLMRRKQRQSHGFA